MTLENLSFCNIHLPDSDCLLVDTAESLTLSNVQIYDCALPTGNSLLAISAANFSADNIFIDGYSLGGFNFMSGLIAYVSSNAEFRNISVYRANLSLVPDNGGSGFWEAGIALLSKSIGGSAVFESIDFYACFAEGLNVQGLACSVGEIASCKDISLDRCSLLCYDRGEPFPGALLFFDYTSMPVFEKNITLRRSLISGRCGEEVYSERGYVIEDCVFAR